MIFYSPGKWGAGVLFRCVGSAFPKIMAWTVPAAILAATMQTLQDPDAELSEQERDKNRSQASLFGIFTSILGFLIALRLQSAYNRWWEGATVLCQLISEWNISFNSLMSFCNTSPARHEEVRRFQHQAARLYSLLMGCGMSQLNPECCKVLDMEGFDESTIEYMKSVSDPCDVVTLWIQRLITEGEACGVVKVPAPILARVFEKLGDGLTSLFHAKRIKTFHIPFPLAQIHMVMLCFNTFTIALFAAMVSEKPTNAALLTSIVNFSYWAALYICLDLEEPFNEFSKNSLPVAVASDLINNHICVVLEAWTHKVPVFNVPDLNHVQIKSRPLPFSVGSDFPEFVEKVDTSPSEIIRGIAKPQSVGTNAHMRCQKLDALQTEVSSSWKDHVPAQVDDNPPWTLIDGIGTQRIVDRTREQSTSQSSQGLPAMPKNLKFDIDVRANVSNDLIGKPSPGTYLDV